MKHKVIRTGNSKAVVIPAEFAQSVGVKIGDEVRVKTEPEKGRIVYTFKGAKQLKLWFQRLPNDDSS